MHYGTYDMPNEPLGEPIRLLRTAADRLEARLCELKSGEIFPLNPVRTDMTAC